MDKVIEKVACVVHYAGGGNDAGFTRMPVTVYGQTPKTFFNLEREDGVWVLVNLDHVIRLEQNIIFKDVSNGDSKNTSWPQKDRIC